MVWWQVDLLVPKQCCLCCESCLFSTDKSLMSAMFYCSCRHREVFFPLLLLLVLLCLCGYCRSVVAFVAVLVVLAVSSWLSFTPSGLSFSFVEVVLCKLSHLIQRCRGPDVKKSMFFRLSMQLLDGSIAIFKFAAMSDASASQWDMFSDLSQNRACWRVVCSKLYARIWCPLENMRHKSLQTSNPWVGQMSDVRTDLGARLGSCGRMICMM